MTFLLKWQKFNFLTTDEIVVKNFPGSNNHGFYVDFIGCQKAEFWANLY